MFIRSVLVASALVLGSVAAAQAVPIYGTSAPLTGSRSVAGGGITETGSLFDALTLSWNITDLGNGTFSYLYTFSGVNDGPSHFNLDLTDDCVGTNDAQAPGAACVTGANGGPLEFKTLTENGTTLIGVKFDYETLVYSFTSDRAPVWGDFQVKKGGGRNLSYAYNTGLTTNHDTSDVVNHFIARPNSIFNPVPVPEPEILAMLGVGLAGLGVLGARRRRNA